MSVGVVVVSHGTIGAAMIEAAEFILGQSLQGIAVVSLNQSGQEVADELADELADVMSAADTGQGVLILTDLPGATPCNLICRAAEQYNRPSSSRSSPGEGLPSAVVSGLNLAMLLRVWNYRDEPLRALTERAIDGGRKGIGASL